MAKKLKTVKTATPVAPVVPVAIPTAVFIAQNVGAMAAANSDTANKVGSLLLDGVAELGARVVAGSETVDVGADYALALRNADLTAQGKASIALDALDKSSRYGMVKSLRIFKERTWSAAFWTNVATLHKAHAITATTLYAFARKVMHEKEPVMDLPSVATLQTWRTESLAKKRNSKGKAGDAESTPAERIQIARDALDGFAGWLPANAKDHAMRALAELATIADMIAAKPAAVEPDKDATIAELKAMLAKLAK